MHVMAPEGVSTCRSKNAKGERVEKVDGYVIACNSLRRNLANEGGGRFRIGATQGGFLCGRKRKGEAGMERAESAEGVTWIQWRKTARKEHKKRSAEKKER